MNWSFLFRNNMEIELKTKSLSEIIKKCNSMKWDINKVKIEARVFENINNPDNFYTKIFLKNG